MTKKRQNKKFYTTFQVAELFSVSFPTVINWVNSGLIQAHRTPGGHRRIAKEEIIAFSRDYNYPIDDDFVSDTPEHFRVLVIADKQEVAEMVSEYLALKGLDVRIAVSGFEAGYLVAKFKPNAVLLDLVTSGLDAFGVVRFLRGNKATHTIPIIAVGNYSDPTLDERVDTSDFDARIAMPIDFNRLFQVLTEILSPPVR